jgi:hypothetical protein
MLFGRAGELTIYLASIGILDKGLCFAAIVPCLSLCDCFGMSALDVVHVSKLVSISL